MPTNPSPILRTQGLEKNFGALKVLKGVDLDLTPRDVVGVIGPSGSGKSTLIRCLNWLETPSAGKVYFHGREVTGQFRTAGNTVGTGELRRKVGMVFQHFNLFPHLTVLENIVKGPVVVLREDPRQVHETALQLLAQVGLSDKCNVYPNHLSGGQKQRVAIARALAMHPEVLLLDEVTSSLDPELVAEVLQVIRGLADKGMTMMIVTHEMGFAADVSNKIIFMEAGRVIESGSPQSVLRAPESDRLKAFLTRFHAV